LDKELRYNIKTKEIEETVVNEDGTETVVKTKVEMIEENYNDAFDRFYDDGCLGWDPDPQYSLMSLIKYQALANQKLQEQGYLFINEVYEMLGLPKCKQGQVVGWLYDKKNPIGDNRVDFGIYNLYKEKNRDFVNGWEKVILLTFNHDGDILSKM
jgi:hypothetical protein